jgi:hypothetical protein
MTEPRSEAEELVRSGHLNGRGRPFKDRTHCGHGHEFTPENTLWRNDNPYGSPRRCRKCKNAGHARWYAERGAAARSAARKAAAAARGAGAGAAPSTDQRPQQSPRQTPANSSKLGRLINCLVAGTTLRPPPKRAPWNRPLTCIYGGEGRKYLPVTMATPASRMRTLTSIEEFCPKMTENRSC